MLNSTRQTSSPSDGSRTVVLDVAHLRVQIGGVCLAPDVSLRARSGDVIRVEGPNGSGKTTLLRMILGLIPRLEGSVTATPPLRLGRTVGYLPQYSGESLLPWLTPADNVLLGLVNAESVEMSAEFLVLVRQFVLNSSSALLRRRGVLESANDLSGGERQKLALLRTLIGAPSFLFLDEPFRELDATAVEALTDYLRSLADSRKAVIAFVSHQRCDLLPTIRVELGHGDVTCTATLSVR